MLEERVIQLEQRVAQLEQRINQLLFTPVPPVPGPEGVTDAPPQKD